MIYLGLLWVISRVGWILGLCINLASITISILYLVFYSMSQWFDDAMTLFDGVMIPTCAGLYTYCLGKYILYGRGKTSLV